MKMTRFCTLERTGLSLVAALLTTPTWAAGPRAQGMPLPPQLSAFAVPSLAAPGATSSKLRGDELAELAARCAPDLALDLVQSLVAEESAYNPYAIGVDAGESPVTQPTSIAEATELARALRQRRVGFSVGLAQIHVRNIESRGLTWEQAFHPCTNLTAAQQVFIEFRGKAIAAGYRDLSITWAALRGYNSGSVHNAVSNRYATSIVTRMASASPAGLPSRSLPTASSRTTTEAASVASANDQSTELFDKPATTEGGF